MQEIQFTPEPALCDRLETVSRDREKTLPAVTNSAPLPRETMRAKGIALVAGRPALNAFASLS